MGAVGTLLRHATGRWAARRFPGLPAGTLIVNGCGSLAIGFLITFPSTSTPALRALLATGFLGGLTTFSSFAYETERLASVRSRLAGIANVVLELAVGLAAVGAGIALAGRL
jgi:CrcB protein